jgi:hypothetical protein
MGCCTKGKSEKGMHGYYTVFDPQFFSSDFETGTNKMQ